MQLGLGAASLTKFCHKKLRMKTTAIELNPQVLAACRLWFKLPADDARLSVVLGDAAEESQPTTTGAATVDALQVDLYDHEAAAPVLDSEDFYADCRRLLTEDGCMTVNLFGRSSSYEAQPEKDRRAFGAEAVWAFKPTREGNTVVLAQRTPSRPNAGELLLPGRCHPDPLGPARAEVAARVQTGADMSAVLTRPDALASNPPCRAAGLAQPGRVAALDGVISPDEAQRTIARCSQAESAQHPLVRLASVSMRAPATASRWTSRR
jgi:hypothetical protein